MSSGSFKRFMAKLESDEVLRQELRAAGFDSSMPVDALVAFAAGKGFEFTIEDVGELSDEQLDSVAGGGEMSEKDMFTLQQMMDKKNQLESMISNIMKAGSDTQNSLASNLKG